MTYKFRYPRKEDYETNNEEVVIKSVLKSNDLNKYLNKYVESFAGEIPLEVTYKIDNNTNFQELYGFGNMDKVKLEDNFLGTSFDSNIKGEFKFNLLLEESIPRSGNFVVNSDVLKINLKRDQIQFLMQSENEYEMLYFQ